MRTWRLRAQGCRRPWQARRSYLCRPWRRWLPRSSRNIALAAGLRSGPVPWPRSRRADLRAALDAREPCEPCQAQDARDIEVQPQSEDMVGGIHAQQLLADACERVARYVEREQARRLDAPALAEPHERAC